MATHRAYKYVALSFSSFPSSHIMDASVEEARGATQANFYTAAFIFISRGEVLLRLLCPPVTSSKHWHFRHSYHKHPAGYSHQRKRKERKKRERERGRGRRQKNRLRTSGRETSQALRSRSEFSPFKNTSCAQRMGRTLRIPSC